MTIHKNKHTFLGITYSIEMESVITKWWWEYLISNYTIKTENIRVVKFITLIENVMGFLLTIKDINFDNEYGRMRLAIKTTHH